MGKKKGKVKPERNAFLHVRLKLVDGKFVVDEDGYGIYSDRYPTNMKDEYYACIMSGKGFDFQDAHDKIIELCKIMKLPIPTR